MRRVTVTACIVAVGLLTWTWAAPAPPPPAAAPQQLAKRVKFDGIDDPKTTLIEALDKLAKLFGVNFDFNEKAFKFEMLMDVGKTPVAEGTPIPQMKNARLDTILRKVLARVPSTSGATYLVRGDHIEITTVTFQNAEVWGSYKGPHLPLVNADLRKTPLEDALHELADQADFNVVLDNRAADKAKTPVSARLRNTPLDSALRLLADMSDLRTVQLDNVLYVTTKENAAALEARLEKEKGPVDEGDPGEPARWRKGSGRDIIPTATGPGAA